MKVHFKYDRVIDGKMYKAGDHEVEDKFSKHWYFLACFNNKDLHYLEHPKQLEGSDEENKGAADDSSAAPESSSKVEKLKKQQAK